jgi:hypothetical protein
MEQEIINIMKSRGLNKLHLEYLIDLGDEYDADGDVYAITCNTVAICDNEVYIYDDNVEYLDGHIDKGDEYYFCELDEDQQAYILWALDATLEYLDKNGLTM